MLILFLGQESALANVFKLVFSIRLGLSSVSQKPRYDEASSVDSRGSSKYGRSYDSHCKMWRRSTLCV